MCHFDKGILEFHLRGLCPESRFDRLYMMESEEGGKPYFKGLATSVIKWVHFFKILHV